MEPNVAGTTFRAWIDKQSIAGVQANWQSAWRVEFTLSGACASVTFLPYLNDKEIVELRIQRSPQASPMFLTHFVLDDIWRARALFREMADALRAEEGRGAYKVFVCFSSYELAQEETPSFVRMLREEARVLPVAYDFVPIDINSALTSADLCSALMLMPSVSSHQKTVHGTHRNSAVFSVPDSLVQRSDARKALRLLLESLGEIDTLAPAMPPIPAARIPEQNHLVLLLNVMYCDRCVRLEWRAYCGLGLVASGKVVKATLSMRDIDDLLGTLFLSSVNMADVEVIGILVPGIVNYCSMNLPSLGDRDSCLADKIEARYNIPVFIENNTNAAAMGCYLLQEEHESLALYRHQLGHRNAGQGIIVGGRLIAGRYGMAGEPKFYQRKFRYENPYAEEVWTENGIARICKNVLLATIGTIEPDAMYVAINTIEDIEGLRRDLEHALPKYCLPDLYVIDDYRERMFCGGVALALERLR